jgi:hypothetical protein
VLDFLLGVDVGDPDTGVEDEPVVGDPDTGVVAPDTGFVGVPDTGVEDEAVVGFPVVVGSTTDFVTSGCGLAQPKIAS